MFSFRVDYLTHRSVASDVANRDTHEWPPHPARFFAALVAAARETGGNAYDDALRWLEALPPPDIAAGTLSLREVTTHFVPVNEPKAMGDVEGRLGLLPERRSRQPRTFPSATLNEPVVHFIWREATPQNEVRAKLEAVARCVTYLGHSSSLVAVQLVDDPGVAGNYVPDAEGGYVSLRVPSEGLLDAYDEAYEVQRATKVRGRLPAQTALYRPMVTGEATTEPPPQQGHFGEMIVAALRSTEGGRYPARNLMALTDTFRRAVLSRWDAVVRPEIPLLLSGHGADGSPAREPHAAFVALPDVAHAHARGHILGVAVVLPVGVSRALRGDIVDAVASVQQLTMGAAGVWELVPPDAQGAPLRTLQESAWRGVARRWASVTPVLLDRFPDDMDGEEAEDIVRLACERAGYPRPRRVLVSGFSVHQGVEPSRHFSIPRREGKPTRLARHVVLEFAERVRGPVLVGAGRFRGMGLCRPWEEDGR